MTKPAEPQVIPDQILVTEIRTIKELINWDASDKKKFPKDLVITIGSSISLIPNENRVIMYYEPTLLGNLPGKKKQLEVYRSGIEVHFEVTNLKEHVRVVEQNVGYQVSAPLAASLAGIGYSTVRGMIFTRLKDTPIGNGFLPVMSPLALVSKEIVWIP